MVFLIRPRALRHARAVTGMIPDAFESKKKYSQSVRIQVTGGQDDEAVGQPEIPNAAFEQALATFIRRSHIFSKVVDDQTEAEDFILVVVLFSIDKRPIWAHGSVRGRLDSGARGYKSACLARFDISEFNGSNV